MATYTSALKPQVIYVFAIDTPLHKGCLKIGMTSLTEDCKHTPGPNDPLLNDIARKRIDQYTKTAAIKYELLYTECSAFIYNGVLQTFNDKQVHEILRRSGIRRPEFSNSHFGTEWYETDLDTVKKAIAAAKEGRTCLSPDEKTQNVPAPIVFRPEQRAAIDMAVKRFTKKGGSGSRQVLWNCKMRFGKTLSALQVVREINAQRTLIVTHRPVVNAGWYEDFEKIFYDCCTTETKSPSATAAGSAKHDKQPARFNYGSATQGESLAQLLRQAEKGMHIIGFASMQDLRGSETVGGQHEKNDNVFATEWDLLIIDEAHEGTQTELGQAVIEQLRHANTKVLQLSGTPFNLIDQYAEEEIFTWDYIMEQRAKMSWDEYHLGDPNPYAALPAMHIYTYDLGNLLADFVDEDKVFNFREFFRTDERGAFVHDDYVGDFLDLLCRNDEDSLYPYANAEFRHIFRHTLWVLPGVKAAKALSQKLQAHPVFGAFTVVNVAGEGDVDEESRDALEKVNKAIGKDPGATQTITLSCGRLTTGVSIRAWTGVFMMSGASSTSAAGYMQTIFRVQTPFEYQGRVKENCYAFDFAPDRALRMLAEASKVSYKAGKQTAEDRHTLADFLSFCPVIAIEGSRMQAFNVDNLLTQLKRVQIERVVNAGFEDGALYNDELLRLEDGDVADFNDLRAKIGTTKALKSVDKVKVSDNGLDGNPAQPPVPSDKKPPKESDPETEALKALENEKKKQRKNAIAILRGISIRMPLLIYGADIQDEAAELTINNFTYLVDDTSWAEFMPAGVTKADFARFRRYYDPEVFSAAGRRIRQLARSADKFTIEERISRLATLF
ncbi:MAG: DEAD/DEAH box helicase family protein, partial [Prevotellaceae bacterium]|nr:DEAD/DEAH box helicase family protein [Prevotellaceae bacterium]